MSFFTRIISIARITFLPTIQPYNEKCYWPITLHSNVTVQKLPIRQRISLNVVIENAKIQKMATLLWLATKSILWISQGRIGWWLEVSVSHLNSFVCLRGLFNVFQPSLRCGCLSHVVFLLLGSYRAGGSLFPVQVIILLLK